MEIRQLRAFLAIAETSTFTAGAVRHITQAAISMQIRQRSRRRRALLSARNGLVLTGPEKSARRAGRILRTDAARRAGRLPEPTRAGVWGAHRCGHAINFINIK